MDLKNFIGHTREFKSECAALLDSLQQIVQVHHGASSFVAFDDKRDDGGSQTVVLKLPSDDERRTIADSLVDNISSTTATISTPSTSIIEGGSKENDGEEEFIEEARAIFATKESKQQHKNLVQNQETQQNYEVDAKEVAGELKDLLGLLAKLRRKFIAIPNFDDPLFDALRFLTCKELFHTVQLTNRRMKKLICTREEQWPKFRFGRLILSTDDDLKKSTKYWLLKNRTELKVPPKELAPIIAFLHDMNIAMDANKNILTPVQLVSHHSTATNTDGHHQDQSDTEAKFVYAIVNVDAADIEDLGDEDEKLEMMMDIDGGEQKKLGRFFILLPNRLTTLHSLAAAIYWFRQLSKVHFESIYFEQYRWSKSFIAFLHTFGINKFLPISVDCFRTYYPLTIDFLQNHIRPNTLSIWDIPSSARFLQYLIKDNSSNNNKNGGGKISRLPELIRVWGFVPGPFHFEDSKLEFVSPNEANSFFDVLNLFAIYGEHPKQIIRRIDLNFKQNPTDWIKIFPGMQLIYKCQTFKLDEDGTTENETLEVRYRLRNTNDTGQKFEVRLECQPEMFEQQMYAFTLIREEDGGEPFSN